MELIPSLISLCGFGIAFTWVLLVHKAVSAGEKADQQALAPKPVTRAEPEHASFLRRHAAAH